MMGSVMQGVTISMLKLIIIIFFNKTAPAVFYYSYTTANSPIITIHTYHILYPFIVIFIIFVERP